ncbi:MAG: metalloregulator ArsR/SmtB family transcription factor [Alphaproteobacteria bacterium]|nr:metalloregulator ArsR/SmtB family transcription factor [Alphaproteobacteria bacterium]
MRQSRTDLDDVFLALADPTRRAILARLAEGEACVGELAEPHDMSFAAISRHVHVLERAGLMHRSKKGRNIVCRFDGAPLDEVSAWVAHHTRLWEQKLDALGTFLEEQP